MENTWKDKELEALEHLGSKTIDQVTKIIQRIDRDNGWLIRSKSAVENKATRLGYSWKTSFDNFPIGELASILKLRPSTIKCWPTRFEFASKKGGRYQVNVRRFKEWAYRNEDRLKGVDREGLLWLIEDESFVDRVCSQHRGSLSVQRVDTGEKFGSIKKAERMSYLSPGTINFHISKGKREFEAGGIQWRLLEKA